MKKILQKILYILARLILLRYKPKIIGITGSVGKTSTKEAVYHVLKEKFNVRRNIKNYNNEIGLPLTVIGSESGNGNPILWLFIFIKALIVLIYWPYPEILILEMGADKPGDIRYLTTLAPCDIGILTPIGRQPVHLENFKNIDQLVREKTFIISHLSFSNHAIINIDDPVIEAVIDKTKAKLITIGEKEKSLLKVTDINYSANIEEALKNNSVGLNFKIHYEGNTVPFKLPNALGKPQIYAALCAIAVGKIFKINLVEISQSLAKYYPPKGRLNIIAGIKGTVILDDSYNSSPKACREALDIVNILVSHGRKIAVLGNMEELGDNSLKAHRDIGRLIAEYNIDILFAVGLKAKDIALAAMEKGMAKEKVFIFDDSREACKTIQQEIHSSDIILIKGSQSARMEIITKEIMAEPLKAEELLVRQDKSWKKK